MLNSREQNTTADVAEMAYQILAYLRDNTGAQDTLEGIVEWWLLDQRIRDQIDRVKEALAYLTARGLVAARTGTDSRTRYALARGRQEEIETILKNRSK